MEDKQVIRMWRFGSVVWYSQPGYWSFSPHLLGLGFTISSSFSAGQRSINLFVAGFLIGFSITKAK